VSLEPRRPQSLSRLTSTFMLTGHEATSQVQTFEPYAAAPRAPATARCSDRVDRGDVALVFDSKLQVKTKRRTCGLMPFRACFTAMQVVLVDHSDGGVVMTEAGNDLAMKIACTFTW
jgi:hypothetical protein